MLQGSWTCSGSLVQFSAQVREQRGDVLNILSTLASLVSIEVIIPVWQSQPALGDTAESVLRVALVGAGIGGEKYVDAELAM